MILKEINRAFHIEKENKAFEIQKLRLEVPLINF